MFRETAPAGKFVSPFVLQFQIVIARPYCEWPIESQTPNSRDCSQTNRMTSGNCFRLHRYILIGSVLLVFKEIENQPIATEQISASQQFNAVPRAFEFLKR